jgi:hypothetical protein
MGRLISKKLGRQKIQKLKSDARKKEDKKDRQIKAAREFSEGKYETIVEAALANKVKERNVRYLLQCAQFV